MKTSFIFYKNLQVLRLTGIESALVRKKGDPRLCEWAEPLEPQQLQRSPFE